MVVEAAAVAVEVMYLPILEEPQEQQALLLDNQPLLQRAHKEQQDKLAAQDKQHLHLQAVMVVEEDHQRLVQVVLGVLVLDLVLLEAEEEVLVVTVVLLALLKILLEMRALLV
jgi:hypothetical protein